jgi:hypothetical protein
MTPPAASSSLCRPHMSGGFSSNSPLRSSAPAADATGAIPGHPATPASRRASLDAFPLHAPEPPFEARCATAIPGQAACQQGLVSTSSVAPATCMPRHEPSLHARVGFLHHATWHMPSAMWPPLQSIAATSLRQP